MMLYNKELNILRLYTEDLVLEVKLRIAAYMYF